MKIGKRINLLKIKDVVEDKDICADCKKFVKKFKEWNEKKIPAVVITTMYRCRKCRLQFEVYKNMISIWKS